MQKDRFNAIKNNVQVIIDFIAEKNAREANNKLVEVSEELDELLDFSEDDEDLMEISRYQVLLNQLHQKIVGLDGQVTGSI
jgi:hypothetical protein